jgi:preprotein translocase subunit YajC
MDPQTHITLNTLLILLVVVVQFFLRSRPQTKQIQELQARLEEVEGYLEQVQGQLLAKTTEDESA